MNKTSIELSLQKSKMVRGYEIKRLALGKYLQAIEAIKEMPETAMKACFPGLNAMQTLEKLKHIDAQMLGGMMMRLAGMAPREAIRLLTLLTDIEEARLLDDPNIGLDGATEMIAAFWELNQIENFISAARELAAQIKAALQAGGVTGFNG